MFKFSLTMIQTILDKQIQFGEDIRIINKENERV